MSSGEFDNWAEELGGGPRPPLVCKFTCPTGSENGTCLCRNPRECKDLSRDRFSHDDMVDAFRYATELMRKFEAAVEFPVIKVVP